ncbi:MAG: hypothetical protein JNM56_28900 [Planctomycetia bacterium]|nr:hypothetical protein [Planctomycetia bacterium]
MQAFARREFLQHTTSAILGFPFAACIADAADAAKKPLPTNAADLPTKGQAPLPVAPEELLKAARERMKQEHKPGVVIVVPADAKAAGKLGNDLAALLGGKNPACAVGEPRPFQQPSTAGAGNLDAHQLFCQAVFVCLPAEAARKAFPRLRADSAAFLFDDAGKIVDEVKASENLFSADFVSQLTSLLHGKQGERLAATAQAQRAALGKEAAQRADTALRSLDSEQFFIRQQASVVLGELAPRATALLAAELRKQPPLETRRRLETFFEQIYGEASEEKPSARLPFGAQWQGMRVDTCPTCGRGSVAAPTRLFLRFLIQDK